MDLVIDTIFGADLSLYDGIRMNSQLAGFDAEAKLLNVRYQGKNYTISRHVARGGGAPDKSG